MREKDEILKTIKIENMVWVLYLVLIGLSFYANKQEEKYYLFKDEAAKSKYRTTNIIVFFLALLVYIYFFNDNYKSICKLDKTASNNKIFLENINFFATLLILIAGTIFLFIAIFDEELETEIAFN